MSVFEKIQACIASIKASDLKKAGRNTFSNYDYYTPEQVDKLVYDACLTEKLINKFELVRDVLGIFGKLTVVCLETGEREEFLMASDIPSITATNISQQLGGAMTYTKRYMLQNTYDIVDNNLDFDADKKPGKAKSAPDNNIEWLSASDFKTVLARTDPKAILGAIAHWTSNGRKMQNKFKDQLNERIKTLEATKQ